MVHVAHIAAPRKAAPIVSVHSPVIDALLAHVDAAQRPAGARHVLRVAHRKLGPQAPAMPAEDLRGLAAAVLSLPGATVDTIGQLAAPAYEALAAASPAIQVDNLLRGTLAADMPADVRSTLRALAGHADSDTGEAWPERATLAGEAGVALRRLDAILEELVRFRWIEKRERFRPQGGKAPSVWTMFLLTGRWGWTAAETKRRRRTPPPPQTRAAREARAAMERHDDASRAPSQCSAARTIAMMRPAHERDDAPRASENSHLEAHIRSAQRRSVTPCLTDERTNDDAPQSGERATTIAKEEPLEETSQRANKEKTTDKVTPFHASEAPYRWEIPAEHRQAFIALGADLDKLADYIFPEGTPMVTSRTAPIVSQTWQLHAVLLADDPRFRVDDEEPIAAE